LPQGRWAGRPPARASFNGKQIKMSVHEIAHPGALPVLAQQHVLRFDEALKSGRELRHELFDAAALFSSLQGHAPDDRELVLCPVRELAPQEFGMLLTALELCGRLAERRGEDVRLHQRRSQRLHPFAPADGLGGSRIACATAWARFCAPSLPWAFFR
jgi:hypothetical protein